ncbi:MAG: DNA polymerase III subunit beta [Armatimonadota bacterium]|nr:DNA polymerase III subunit beta [bacterium]
MKVICARKDLYEGVQTAGRAVSPRTSLPILGHLLITAEEDKIRIAATDLEIGMECIVDAKVEEPGNMTVPARTVTEILAALPDTDVALSVDDTNTVSLKCGTSDYSILGLPADEFPMLPEVREEVSVVVEHDAIREAIKRTAFAISQDESRAILTGILTQVIDGGLKLVSTDGHRLCLQECAVVESHGAVNAIVPGRALNELSRIVPEGQGTVEVKIAPSQIMFRVGETILISRLIEGQFPNYDKVIPKEHTKKLTVPTEQLLQSVKRAEIVARENSHRTIVSVQDGTLTVTAESGNVGRAHEEVEVIKEGEDIRMAFNARYLMDVLNVIDTEAIEVELSGEVSPAVIRPQGQEEYTYVLMPMQVE